MDSRNESRAGILNPIAEEALHRVVRRLDNEAWTEPDEAKLRAWRATAPEYDLEFIRHEFIANLISQPQAHRDEARQFQHGISAVSEDSKLPSEAKNLLKRAEVPGLPVAKLQSLLDEAISRFRLLIAPTHTRHRRLFAQVLMRRGNLRRATDGRKYLPEILRDYDEAETQLLVLLPDQNPSWRDDLADLCTQRGIALMSVGSRNYTSLTRSGCIFSHTLIHDTRRRRVRGGASCAKRRWLQWIKRSTEFSANVFRRVGISR